MYCTATDGGADAFAVRGEFLTGAVAGCEALAGDTGQPPIKATDGISIWNPDGDTRRLGIGWEDSACTISGTVSLYPTMAVTRRTSSRSDRLASLDGSRIRSCSS